MAVQLDPELLEILACPCPEHAPLLVGTPETGTLKDGSTDYLTCTACHRRFPVRDGIPVLLLDEAELPDGSGPADSTAKGGAEGTQTG